MTSYNTTEGHISISFHPSVAKPRARAGPHTGDPLLFADTSSAAPPMNNQGYYTPGYNIGGAPVGGPEDAGVNNLFADPMASAAMMYGSSLANQGKDIVNKEVRESQRLVSFSLG